jgi:hypothetical protein
MQKFVVIYIVMLGGVEHLFVKGVGSIAEASDLTNKLQLDGVVMQGQVLDVYHIVTYMQGVNYSQCVNSSCINDTYKQVMFHTAEAYFGVTYRRV